VKALAQGFCVLGIKDVSVDGSDMHPRLRKNIKPWDSLFTGSIEVMRLSFLRKRIVPEDKKP
jgi:hypothetical protein